MTTPPLPNPTAPWRRRLLLAAVLAALASGGVLGWRGLRDRAEREEVREAERLPFDDAEPRLLRLAERRPNDAAVARALALGYLEGRRLTAAEPYFARWCALRPDDAEPFRKRAQLWKEWMRVADAVADAGRALRLEPGDLPLRQQLARWLFTLGRFDEAERECQRCLDEEPDHPAMLQLRAVLHHRQGRTAEATAAADGLLRDFPTYGDAHVLRGVLHFQADQTAEAIACFRRALALEGPHHQAAYDELRLALARAGQAEEARKAMAESRLLHEVDLFNGQPNRDPVELPLRIAELLLTAGRFGDAQQMLTRLEKEHPNNPTVHRLLAIYYEQRGKPQLAAEHRARFAEGQRTKDKGQRTNP